MPIPLLLNLLDDLTERIYKFKRKFRHFKRYLKNMELDKKIVSTEYYLEYKYVNDDILLFKCSCCNKRYQEKSMKT